MPKTDLDARFHAYRPELADARLQGRVTADRFVDGRPARVTVPVAGLYREPYHASPLDTQAIRGDRVTLFECTGSGWAWVQIVHDDYVGWMDGTAFSEEGQDPTHRVCVPRTVLFSEPDIKSPPLDFLPLGAAVRVAGEATDHNARYAVLEPKGAIVSQHLCPIGHQFDDFVSVAELLTGTPYLFGGNSAFGIDCSALIQIAMRMTGSAVPRDSDMQEAAIGTQLSEGSRLPPLQRADIVFWKGHCGIMRDSATLLHANAHHMAVASEPLAEAVDRISRSGLDVTSVRRP